MSQVIRRSITGAPSWVLVDERTSALPLGAYFNRDALLVPSPGYCRQIIAEHDNDMLEKRIRSLKKDREPVPQ